MTGYCQVTTTLPDRATADRLAGALVGERLAACAQIHGPVESTYRWRDAIERATEWYCHLKTTAERFPALCARIRALHPYETPEIIALPVLLGDADYLAWVRDAVATAPPRPDAPRPDVPRPDTLV